MKMTTKLQSAELRNCRAFLKRYDNNFVAVFLKPNDGSEEGMRDTMHEMCIIDSVERLLVLTKAPLKKMSLSMPKFTLKYMGDLEQSCNAILMHMCDMTHSYA